MTSTKHKVQRLNHFVPPDINKKAWERETCRLILGCIEVEKKKHFFSIHQRRVSRRDVKIKKATKGAQGTKNGDRTVTFHNMHQIV